MPFDPYLVLNAMLRAEASRFSPSTPSTAPVRRTPDTDSEPARTAEPRTAEGPAEQA
ncbi:hypothetical protein OG389_20135 [Streptomyces sp. NBC_00435]|uniref:hypothetical protein n=1 Tax=Streptomyces sp. NBC_00435 TaxID=2903649 RepID=UPI002E1E6BEE